ncbi:ribosomal RNA large subunit methyltransferase E [Anaplasma platys]|uniref:Ribosomal RNA large subunit methyltransferase E n=1 Tax=Anaplasma platys TaxID=949 RepID=A0A858PY36_9RICK|nr:ribosomal RNA large subunit methyltransferase E [Anaplasma platys]
MRPGSFVLDLGAYPGGWSQVAAQQVVKAEGKRGLVIAVDLQQMEAIDNVTCLRCDIESEAALLDSHISHIRFDVVLSDMAPRSCGHRQVDHANIINLCELARDMALQRLRPLGCFITKILHGEFEQEFRKSVIPNFETVSYFKPRSSRSESSEMYLVALKFKG